MDKYTMQYSSICKKFALKIFRVLFMTSKRVRLANSKRISAVSKTANWDAID